MDKKKAFSPYMDESDLRRLRIVRDYARAAVVTIDDLRAEDQRLEAEARKATKH
jgi:hypothetical protein